METNKAISKANGQEQHPEFDQTIIQSLVLNGDLSKMSDEQKVMYYNGFCKTLGLNPLTQPFKIMKLQGKEVMYATKDCTEQLRKIYGISITDIEGRELKDTYMVVAKAQDRTGKTDAASGLVAIANLKGEALANAIMKAETKAKRRVTLSICGLGILDETELDTVNNQDLETRVLIKEEVPQLPDELDGIIEEADMDALENIWKTNKELQSNPDFIKKIKSRKTQLQPA